MDIKNAAYPALHLWWRYYWRIGLFLFVIGIIFVIAGNIVLGINGMMFFVKMIKTYPSHITSYDMKVLGVILMLILIFFIAALFFEIWLFRSVLFKKNFVFNDKPEIFLVNYDNKILNIPLAWSDASRLWWGVFWRGFVLGIIAHLLFFWTGTLMILINIAVSYLAFLWLLSYNYGKTKIIISAPSCVYYP